MCDGGRRALYVGLSASGGTEGAALPPPPAGTSWHAVVDTGDEPFAIHLLGLCRNGLIHALAAIDGAEGAALPLLLLSSSWHAVVDVKVLALRR